MQLTCICQEIKTLVCEKIMVYHIDMKKTIAGKKIRQEQENIKILKEFFKKSGDMIDAAIKESHRKYPDLFKSS